ncbi:hypothetical protein PACTADRAFT_5170 [Pachysolen tannophilus NRRL Y-2460]|uniref:Uncharacterized protein n=1 Tax=Pachysolen tannophilus NRRL Y-2460 TaxID=669874 RepID=A0A1E4TNS0_PACTA|nr:hypothetical protein PACTADRAFT_5170 [Pachysolen tannophilus NRRL Y-2460]
MEEPPKSLAKVKHIILVLSGKGGVGKSSVTTQTALTLVSKGYKVGVLDIDLTGPSIPRMFGLEGKKIHQSSKGWVPVHLSTNLKIMSLGFLINDRGSSVVWRGPKKQAMIKQMLSDVFWDELDYLIIDTPPGTSDEHITIAEELKFANPDGCILVTTPQQISVDDVKKEINFCNKVKFKILGLIENMSGFVCPYCDECTNIFSSDGGMNLCRDLGLRFLGKLPIDPSFNEMIETQGDKEGKTLVDFYKENTSFTRFNDIIQLILDDNLPNRLQNLTL